MKTKGSSGLRWLWLTVITLLLDRATKYLAQKYLLAYYALPIIPGFNLTLSFNKGAAFSFLNSASGWQVEFFGCIAAVVSIVLIISLARLSSRERLVCAALSLIIGGALGNLWDRISYSYVIDFIQLYISNYYWPTFNIADSAICLGALILLVNSLKKSKTHGHNH
ncbi:MAG: lipoprotein signal peptidase [Gammaproteobacteria bacterium]|nr:lipoprotein signal peptidase [Gammaproteobacteria bacterium]